MNVVSTEHAIEEVATVGIPVRDQSRSLQFYVTQLGLKLRVDEMRGHERWIEVAPAGSQTTIALVRGPDQVRMGIDTQIRLTTKDAARLRDELERQGVDVDPELSFGPMAMFGLRDPDRNRLVIEQR